MSKSPSPSNSPSGKSAAIDKIVDRLVDAIDQMPLLSMISSVRFPGEAENSDVKKAETDVIKALSTLAEMGNMNAEIALRKFENSAAEELSILVSDPITETARKNHISPVGDSPVYHTVYSLPLVKVEGDLSPIKNILKSEAKTIESLSEEEILARVGGPRIAGRRQCVVNALAALGVPKDTLDEHRRLTSKGSVSYDHPVSILEMLYAEVERSKDQFAMKKRQARARIAMNELIGYLLEDQLSKLLKDGTGELPSNSLKLEHPVYFVPRATVNKGDGKKQRATGGRPRRITPGGPAHFALEYCMALDDVRRLHIGSSDSEKADWDKTIRRIEKVLKLAEEADIKKTPDLLQDREALYQGQTLRILWTCKAALLPEFPYPNRDSDAAAERDLKLWLDAAVVRARMICGDDWEHYWGWPRCVETKRAHKTAHTAVKEKLKEGMERLELVGTTTP